MLEALKKILDIQELDIKMIQLMRVKRQRQKELDQIKSLRTELDEQMSAKKEEVEELSSLISQKEEKIEELSTHMKELEAKQSAVKKVEEFNALTQEMTQVERQKVQGENELSELVDKKVIEEEILAKIEESASSTATSSQELEVEIQNSISQVNSEGSELKAQRDKLAVDADESILHVYERLLRNKKDRVVVPLENRTCSGCHITLTPQHENLVRKGENLVFCEHCSRIHYWQESEAFEDEAKPTRRRRRRTTTPS
ncbi:MAG: C4-type zinc ribbon domain-containing protein [Candidatus Algichlamydia australiensis]|nr:C4-type zinc ribbon domain-containing protein [Chlamydiales bacterium]